MIKSANRAATRKKRPMGHQLGIVGWFIAPFLATMVGLMLVSLPVRLGAQPVPMPIVPLIVIFIWAMYRPNAWAAVIIFALGILQDLLLFGPVGLWAALYLMVYASIAMSRRMILGRQRLVIWALFALTALITAVLATGLAWALSVPVSVRLMVVQMLFTIILYPFVSRLLRAMQQTPMHFHREDTL